MTTCPTCSGTRTVRLSPCLDCAPIPVADVTSEVLERVLGAEPGSVQVVDLTVANILEADRAWRRPGGYGGKVDPVTGAKFGLCFALDGLEAMAVTEEQREFAIPLLCLLDAFAQWKAVNWPVVAETVCTEPEPEGIDKPAHRTCNKCLHWQRVEATHCRKCGALFDAAPRASAFQFGNK